MKIKGEESTIVGNDQAKAADAVEVADRARESHWCSNHASDRRRQTRIRLACALHLDGLSEWQRNK
jgi:hypothetical protein